MNRYSNKFGFYELMPFPGCNQLVVSNHAFILPEYRKLGFGQAQHKERLEKIKELKYNYVVCTVRADNGAEIHILEKHGWKLLDSFFNEETNMMVHIYGRSV